MANIDQPEGLTPVKFKSGRPYNGASKKYYVPATDNVALFIGDAVIKTAGVNESRVTNGTTVHEANSLMTVTRATAGDGNAITGVVVGVEARPDSRTLTHRAASTEAVVLVADDPDLLFTIQADGIVPAASVGLNAVLINTHAGSATTGRSGTELDTSSDVPAADASNQLTIVGFAQIEDRKDVASANPLMLVAINQHTESDNTIGLA